MNLYRDDVPVRRLNIIIFYVYSVLDYHLRKDPYFVKEEVFFYRNETDPLNAGMIGTIILYSISSNNRDCRTALRG